MLGINLVFWHHSIDRIGAGLATVLANTHVLFVLAGVLATGGAVARRSLYALPLPLIGVALIGGVGSDHHLDGLGLLLGLAAGATYGMFQLCFDRAIRITGSDTWPLCLATAGAAVFGEAMRTLQAVGVALVLGGVLLARLTRRPADPAQPGPR